MSSLSRRLGVDIGGTFTDVVLESGDARHSTKVLTTHEAPEEGIVAGVRAVCAKADTDPGRIGQIVHGTTLATNALIERRGARTALITTAGFRDVIEMRTESRFEQYDLNLVLPEPLLSRQNRLTLRERVNAAGEVLVALDGDELDAVVERVRTGRYESVAVGLLHSYANPAHERVVRDALAARLPEVAISLSSDVSPQMREYERFNTVVANAYIKPLIRSYLGRLEGRLQAEGVRCPVLLMHSGGGIMSIESAAEFPVRLVESGPAGGAVFAADVAARHALDKVLSFDMGGTTAKICLIRDRVPKTSRVFEVARTYRFRKGSGMPVSIPVIDMVEIGAGGGSLAQVDAMRQIRVGPESAGSEPGPACYGRGGERPAVTDADLLLGKLDPDDFAGGSIALDVGCAARALDAAIGGPLELTSSEAAFGVAEMVDENMANAARVHAVENGEELSGYTMIAFGGAAPLHAARLCEKLGIDRLLVPPGAGVGSAIGFLRAPFSFEATRSVYTRLSDFDPATIGALLLELREEASGFVRSCDAASEVRARFRVYMRYTGQGWEIPIELSEAQALEPDAVVLRRRFEEDYAALFGRTVDGMDVEATVWAVNATTPARPSNSATSTGTADDTRLASVPSSTARADAIVRPIFDPALGRAVEALVVRRAAMRPDGVVAGPAAIVEDETTIIVPSSRRATLLGDGCIELRAADGEGEEGEEEGETT